MTKDDINKMGLRELRNSFVELCGDKWYGGEGCLLACPFYENSSSCEIPALYSITESELREALIEITIKEKEPK